MHLYRCDVEDNIVTFDISENVEGNEKEIFKMRRNAGIQPTYSIMKFD